MARSQAASVLRYVKSAPVEEVKVTLELAREEYRQRVTPKSASPAPKRRRNKNVPRPSTEAAAAQQ